MRRILAIGALLAALLGAPSAAQALGPGIVKGTVKPEAIAAEVEVCVLESQPSETCTYPAPDGTYTLKGLPVGPDNVIEFLPSYRSHYLSQYFDHVSRASEATKIPISTPPDPHEKQGVNADLLLGGQIEGVVSAASGGAPLAEIEACAFSAIEVSAGCAQSDATGHYALPTLPAGNYKVGFFAHGASAPYISSYYGGASTYAASPPAVVSAGATVSGIDAELEQGATISGTVSATTGAPLAGISVCLFAATQQPERCRFSDEGGEYSFTGLASARYEVGFSLSSAELAGEGGAREEDAYPSQYYAGADTLAGATPIALTAPASVTGVDASLTTPQATEPEPPAVLPVQVVPAPLLISEPLPKRKTKCKRGYRRRKVMGKVRCVRVGKPRRRHGRGSGPRG